MNYKEKKEIIFRLIARVQTGLSFLDDYFYRQSSTSPDIVYLRSIYILFSYHTELLLKAVYINSVSFNNIDDLDNHLKQIGHNLKEIDKRLKKDELMKYGIKEFWCRVLNCDILSIFI